MGADLYIKDLDRKRQYTGFRTDIGVGYYRDSYNNWNLLWQFGLSYWTDIKKFHDEEGIMSSKNAEKLLKELQTREVLFEKNMQDLMDKKNIVWDYKKYGEAGNELEQPVLEPEEKLDRVKAQAYYRKHYKELKAFLKKAIKLKSDVECSL